MLMAHGIPLSLDLKETNLLISRMCSLAKKIGDICKARFTYPQHLNLFIPPLYHS